MNMQRLTREEEATYRVVERDDAVEHVVDLGPSAADAAVDVVDGTAIVVVGDDQYDLDVGEDAQAFIRNGVLTIDQEDSE